MDQRGLAPVQEHMAAKPPGFKESMEFPPPQPHATPPRRSPASSDQPATVHCSIMPSVPDHLTGLIISAVVGAWLLAIAGILILRWHYNRRIERIGEASSEEILAELKTAYKQAPRIRIQTQTEYLPFLIESIRENIESGLGDDQVQLLLERIENHRLGDERQAMFPIESSERSSDLRLSWTCDENQRIDLRIQGDPVIILALREFKKKIPKATICGQAGRS